jgi:hypothetical protein
LSGEQQRHILPCNALSSNLYRSILRSQEEVQMDWNAAYNFLVLERIARLA